jgi:hypothetical protein
VTVSAEVTAIGLAEPSGGGPPPQQTPRSTGPVTGAIYRISADGAWDLAQELRDLLLRGQRRCRRSSMCWMKHPLRFA